MSSWATLLKCTPDQQFMEHLKVCHTSKIPVRWPGQCYGCTLSLWWHWIILEYVLTVSHPPSDFLYCLACKILSKKLLDGVHFAIQDGGPKRFPFKWQHWFLVSGMSELSKNVYIYISP